ncbi:hypothetical protein SAMN02910447_03341 [Ruminococcus sp. YE71]|uniref:hypothetical protein n=1 Tax=unclassified Ruminococcus TaxID=2608920 RepID=UPI00088260FF|nr:MULTISPECIES: hypothetical protein [unclassified Ruminococcus]SDA31118.1 hypothetical protein SAMN02910446_03410 [Ruminococcus sp. YE78]SFW51087.1 hypothetical protein SAMN02910447_03341 [Ruminococcus sp. YE71]
MAKVKKTYTLDKEAVAVLEQISLSENIPVSTLLNSFILQKGVELGILEIDEVKDSIYDDREIKYNYTEGQTRFENLLLTSTSKVVDTADKTNSTIREVDLRVGDVEKIVYQLRDLINIFIGYSLPQDGSVPFSSADEDSDNYDGSIFLKKSLENYRRKAERLRTDSTNFGGRK